MATKASRGYRTGLVDLQAGEISREIFVNEDIYAEEQERIFARAWLHVGHESQIPKRSSNSYATTTSVTRGRPG